MEAVVMTRELVERFKQMLPGDWLRLKSNQLYIGACQEDNLVGISVWEVQEPGAGLKWIYVLPEHRRHGAGRLMLKKLKEVAPALHIEHVLFEHVLQNDGAVQFFEAEGFTLLRDPDVVAYSKDTVVEKTKKEIFKKAQNGNATDFHQLPIRAYKALMERVKKSGYYRDSESEKRINRDSSYACLDAQGHAKACLISSVSENTLTVDLVISFGEDPLAIIQLFGKLYAYLADEKNGIERVEFLPINPKFDELIQKLVIAEPSRSSGPVYGVLCVE